MIVETVLLRVPTVRSVTRDGILCVTRIDGTKGVRRYPEGRFSLSYQ